MAYRNGHSAVPLQSKARKLLAKHIATHWRTQQEFAEAANLPYLSVNGYVTGRRRPNLEHAFAIEDLTREVGDPTVPARDWLTRR